MTRRRTRRTQDQNTMRLPCMACGVPFLQDIRKKARPCNTEKCVKEQQRRKALYYAEEAKRKLAEYTPTVQSVSEDKLRYGPDVAVVESIDGNQPQEVSVIKDGAPDSELIIPDDIDEISDSDLKRKVALAKEVKLIPEKVKRGVTLEQLTVLALPVTVTASLHGYTPDEQSGRPLPRPQLTEDEKRIQYEAAIKRLGPKCLKHPDHFASSCFPCRTETDTERARKESAMRQRAPIGISAKPSPVVVDPKEAMLASAQCFFGLNKPIAAQPHKVMTVGLTSPTETAIPWYATHPKERQRYFEERMYARPRSKRISVPVPQPDSRSEYREGLSFRKILGLSRQQIAEWLTHPYVLYGPPVDTACQTVWITTDSDIEMFELQNAEEIVAIESQIADYERELTEIEARRAISGLDGRVIAGKKRSFIKSIEKYKKEITKIKRRRPPKDLSDEGLTEVEVPDTEVPVFDERRCIPESDVKLYLNDLPNMSLDGDDQRLFENGVIRRAIGAGVCTVEASISAAYPEITTSEVDLTLGDDYDHPENTLILKTRGESSGLTVHGAGWKLRGEKLVHRDMDFDRVLGNNSGDGAATVSRGHDSPDYDPSDDTSGN